MLLFAALLRAWYAVALQGAPLFVKYPVLGRALFNGEIERPFTSSPGYIFLVGLAEKLTGGTDAIRWLQFALGVLSVGLIIMIAKRLAGPLAGLAAGAIYLFYEPAYVYEGGIVTASWVIFLNLAAYAALLGWSVRCDWKWAIPAGLCLGLGLTLRPNNLAFIGLAGLWMYWQAPGWTLRIKSLLPWGCAVLIPVIPVTVFNFQKSGDFVLITGSSGLVFYSSHNYRASGLGYAPPPLLLETQADYHDDVDTVPVEHQVAHFVAEQVAGQDLTNQEANAVYKQATRRYLKTYPTAAGYLFLKKLIFTIHNYEHYDQHTLEIGRWRLEDAWPFTYGFGLVLSFGVAGFFWLRREQLPHAALLLAAAAPHLLTALLFYVNGRLRTPLAPLLCILGGLAVSGIVARYRQAPRKLVASGALASAVLILGQYSIGEITHYQDRSLFYFGGQRAFTEGHLDIAAQAFQTLIDRAPLEADDARLRLAEVLEKRGQAQAAGKERRLAAGQWKMRELDALPDEHKTTANYHTLRAGALVGEGHTQAALEALILARELHPAHPLPSYYRASFMSKMADPDWDAVMQTIETALANDGLFSPQGNAMLALKIRAAQALGNQAVAAECRKRLAWRQSHAFKSTL
jgi:4-amino-4-deoxy-L-arabinose transferase-like glycosyltransferase